MDAVARIEALIAQKERLAERVAQLEAALGLGFLAPLGWRLTRDQHRIFGVLMARELATRDAIMAALYRDTGRDEAEIKIVDVQICKLRAKLKPIGIEVETVWGQGYRISPASKADARALLAQERAP